MLLSLFCGAGGLDLGFEAAGFEIGLAFDKKLDSILSYNRNRKDQRGHCEDVQALTLDRLDELWGSEFRPSGVIGGPPCQSFSKANRSPDEDDPRHQLPLVYAGLLARLNERNPLSFFVLENVPGLAGADHRHRLEELVARLEAAGFAVEQRVLNAHDFATPQKRDRLFLVGINRTLAGTAGWQWPEADPADACLTVQKTISHLPEPAFFQRGLAPELIPHHPNHWCMKPKSRRFFEPGALIAGDASHRSFKTLAWDRPSITVAYGNREVHVHPNCQRRLSVYEAMLLQGFPPDYVLTGSLSSQIAQVSEAVPPPLAEAVARAVLAALSRAAQPSHISGAGPTRHEAAGGRARQARTAIRQRHSWRRQAAAPSR